jgi:ABC-type antimicrobial peptide transport system permease subunit
VGVSALAVVVAVGGALVPARRASRVEVLDALRWE